MLPAFIFWNNKRRGGKTIFEVLSGEQGDPGFGDKVVWFVLLDVFVGCQRVSGVMNGFKNINDVIELKERDKIKDNFNSMYRVIPNTYKLYKV